MFSHAIIGNIVLLQVLAEKSESTASRKNTDLIQMKEGHALLIKDNEKIPSNRKVTVAVIYSLFAKNVEFLFKGEHEPRFPIKISLPVCSAYLLSDSFILLILYLASQL